MQNHKKLSARILSLALSATMVFTTLPATVFAATGDTPIGASSICEHHLEHTAECGYTEGTAGTPCTHECELCKPSEALPPVKDDIVADTCICGTLCTEGAINADCPVCSAKGADLAGCKGTVAMPMMAPTPRGTVAEQFTLATGQTYYFDLSGELGTVTNGVSDKIGTINPGHAGNKIYPGVPDPTLHYVPFTYAGTVNAYSLTSGQASTDATASDRSLFVADYNVSRTISWNELAGLAKDGTGAMPAANLIFGKTFDTNYKLRSLSAGSSRVNEIGSPATNEWDSILGKSELTDPIKNWRNIFTWGQDTSSSDSTWRALRGSSAAADWSSMPYSSSGKGYGWRPALEVLNPATLGADGLKAVALNLGGGSFDSNGSEAGGAVNSLNIVCAGDTFKAPSATALTRPSGNTGTYFKWNTAPDGSGTSYDVGATVPSSVTALYAQWAEPTVTEQFTLPIGGTYYFDLSSEAGNIGTINIGNTGKKPYPGVPDPTLHYVPFTYAGTVNAYSLTSGQASTAATASARSLFVADYNVSHTISWDTLNTANLIFGKEFDTNYKLRSLSGGHKSVDTTSSVNGSPTTNEWDSILTKNSGWIKNWSNIFSWGQDTSFSGSQFRALRGLSSAAHWNHTKAPSVGSSVGWRPALEVLNPGTLGKDGLKAVTLDLNGGSFDSKTGSLNIVCAGASFTAPSGKGLTRPSGDSGTGFHWKGSDNKVYAVGADVPNTVTSLTAQWSAPPITTHTITASAGTGGNISPSGSVTVNNGESKTFTITPNSGYSISSVTVDGVNQGAIGSHTFSNVTASHSISATFSYNGSGGSDDSSTPYYYIKATAGPGGSMSTAERVKVRAGESAGFTITPNKGYQIADVLVNGKSIGAKKYYAFTKVYSDQTIHATFKKGGHQNPQTGVSADEDKSIFPRFKELFIK